MIQAGGAHRHDSARLSVVPCRQEVDGVKIEVYCRRADVVFAERTAVDIETRSVGMQ